MRPQHCRLSTVSLFALFAATTHAGKPIRCTDNTDDTTIAVRSIDASPGTVADVLHAHVTGPLIVSLVLKGF